MIENKFERRQNSLLTLKQIKYIEDTKWGAEHGKWNWIEPLSYYEELYEKYPDSFITVHTTEINIHGEEIDRVIAVAIVSPMNKEFITSTQDFIEKEREFDNINYWTNDKTDLYNLFICIVDKNYANDKVESELLQGIKSYFSSRPLAQLFSTAVIEEEELLLNKIGKVIATKEEQRKVYQIDLNKLV